MRTSIAILAVVTALSACAADTFQEDFSRGMRSFIDQPIDDAIARLGPPESERTIRGKTTYRWSTMTMYASPSLSSTVGYAGNTPFTAQSYGGSSAMPLACAIDLTTDDAGIVTTGRVDGSRGACEAFLPLMQAER